MYTPEDIKSAEIAKQEIIQIGDARLIGLYGIGRIIMWSEMSQKLEEAKKEADEWRSKFIGETAQANRLQIQLADANRELDESKDLSKRNLQAMRKEIEYCVSQLADAKEKPKRFGAWLMDNCSMRNNSKKWHIVKGAFTESFTTDKVYEKFESQFPAREGSDDSK